MSGISDDLFLPQSTINEAQAIVMLAKAFHWTVRTNEKVPLASDYFTKIDNAAWYA